MSFPAGSGQLFWIIKSTLCQVEPAQRAYRELAVKSIITGRRASQGGARTHLLPLEVDSTGLLKLNPFFSWTFGQVQNYLDENEVPRNALLSQGYKSVGDWHSTVKSGEGDAGERAGRWAGKEKTECGLHQDYFKLKRLALKNQVCTENFITTTSGVTNGLRGSAKRSFDLETKRWMFK